MSSWSIFNYILFESLVAFHVYEWNDKTMRIGSINQMIQNGRRKFTNRRAFKNNHNTHMYKQNNRIL